MKHAIIVHCWEGVPDYCWYPYVKRELEKEGFDVQVPEMPDTAHPKLTNWLAKLEEVAGNAERERESLSELYLIGHSLGCITIMRYLESLPLYVKVGGVVFVAGFTDGLNAKKYLDIQNFFAVPIDFEKIKTHCDKFVAIASDDDPYVPIKYVGILEEKLGVGVIIKHNMKHFSGAVDNEESCTELPEVVTAVLKFTDEK